MNSNVIKSLIQSMLFLNLTKIALASVWLRGRDEVHQQTAKFTLQGCW